MEKPLAVNPLKTSPALGAAYALQGIKGALPVFHAAPGCTFLGKVLLTQHLREPVALLGTDIKEIPTIMGGGEELEKKIAEAQKKFNPTLIGIIGTALTEVRGEDVERICKGLPNVFYISCPDYLGGFSEGYARAIAALLDNFGEGGGEVTGQISIIPSASFTLGDIEEIKDIISSFGLKPLVLPDLSVSIDGSKERYSILPVDGTTLEDIKRMRRSSAVWPIPIGLEATDVFIKSLMEISGNQPSEKIQRDRKRLIDGMIDTHLIMAGKKIVIGLEKDLTDGINKLCADVGAGSKPALFKDLEDLEDSAKDADLIITNSHGKEAGTRCNVPLLRMGFPITDRFGEPLKVRVGYRGSLNLLYEMANIFMERIEK